MTVSAELIPTAADMKEDIPDVPIYRLTVAQYHAMARAGILDEDAPVELLEGWLVQKMTKHRPHSRCTHLTRRAFESLLPPGWYVDSQEPITLATSEPEPDVVVIRGDNSDYIDRQPGPQDVVLVIEVAERSLRTDQGRKKRVYACAGIPVYWIVNLKARQIEVYTEPEGSGKRSGYRHCHNYGVEDAIPVVLDGVEVGTLRIAELLP
jgi:Uma2 family endonuclease